jgi:hypothetical protein
MAGILCEASIVCAFPHGDCAVTTGYDRIRNDGWNFPSREGVSCFKTQTVNGEAIYSYNGTCRDGT